MHIAGHTKFEKYILDTHDHPVLDPVWKLYAHATARCGVTATLLEWDDKIPSFDEVHDEALKANEFIGGREEGRGLKREGPAQARAVPHRVDGRSARLPARDGDRPRASARRRRTGSSRSGSTAGRWSSWPRNSSSPTTG